ncbi:hypothetical protein IFM89_032812 [Coptis chinensis]|uniref:Reverse transcriptase zinc-binding domain-containing protein n=1 Tax=Coptis chinensis TaxID=261450 RepID=A0A835HLB3_9MAGN|nr:hypothetical protein IFM89_032812 [Coptis chinensis]
MVRENNGLTWNFKLRHGVREWHIDGVIRMLDALAGLTPSVEEDKWVWKQSSNGNFSSRSFYNLLASSMPYPPQPITPKLLSMAWRSGVPPKVQFFLWCLLQGKILTTDQLRTRGKEVEAECVLCSQVNETADHLMLHCSFSKGVS